MKIESLLPIESVKDFDKVLKKVDELGEVVILKDNMPAYRVTPIVLEKDKQEGKPTHARLDLWEAMDIVLSEQNDNTMHAKDIAAEISKRELYFMKDGSVVSAVQIRARAGHKSEYFQCIKGNFIKLIKRYSE